MEPSSPISAGRRAPTRAVPPAAASITLPLQFMLVGLLALLAGVGWLIARPELLATYHYNQHIIAVTHLFVLGWISSVVMGALYQLVPVVLETQLHSPRLARWQFACHTVGFAGMVWMFNVWNMEQVGHFGSLLAFGVGLFVYNLARTLWRIPRWNVVAAAVTAALIWISLAVLAGLALAAAKCACPAIDPSSAHRPAAGIIHTLQSIAGFVSRFDPISAMHAHAHLGAVGFFLMLIVGVSYKLVPLFTLSELQNPRRAAGSIALLNLGLAGVFVAVLLRSRWKPVFALVIGLALLLYGAELRAILRARKRRPLDWGIKYFLTAVALLAPLSALALVLSWPALPLTPFTGQLENVYGFLGLIGVVSLAIIGMLYKIIPFLVWFGAYSKHVGRARVPQLADMYSARLQAVGYWTFLAGLVATLAATVIPSAPGVRAGCALLAASILTLVVNVGRIAFHYLQPQLLPLAPPAPAKPAVS